MHTEDAHCQIRIWGRKKAPVIVFAGFRSGDGLFTARQVRERYEYIGTGRLLGISRTAGYFAEIIELWGREPEAEFIRAHPIPIHGEHIATLLDVIQPSTRCLSLDGSEM